MTDAKSLALLDNLDITQLQMDKARGLLRTMLGKEIALHPCADGEARYLTRK